MQAPGIPASLVNHTLSYSYPSTTAEKLAGRDFQVLTRYSTMNWFDRWIFPKDFPSPPISKIRIARTIRWFKECDASQTELTAKDPITNDSDADYLYELTKVAEQGNFVKESKNAEDCKTEIYSDPVKLNNLYLTLSAGNAFVKFQIKEKICHCTPDNKLLDAFFPK